MTQEIYKRYRPKSLDRVVGNEDTVESLRTMLRRKRVPHTILFSGPSGCGKTTLARILATELKCHPMDVVELNCANTRGIDTVRDIMSTMSLAPTGGEARVWILDECHQLAPAAQQSTLKMLEDTPKHVYFFLCTTDPQKLLKTIRTRCTDMPVVSPGSEAMRKLLTRVLAKEQIELGKGVDEALEDMESPRAMLVALDKIRHVPQKRQLSALKKLEEEDNEAIELCRALLQKKDWPVVSKILRNLKGEPEQTRWAVLGYARAILLSKKDPHAFFVIQAFEEPFFNSKDAGLARAAYEALYGN